MQVVQIVLYLTLRSKKTHGSQQFSLTKVLSYRLYRLDEIQRYTSHDTSFSKSIMELQRLAFDVSCNVAYLQTFLFFLFWIHAFIIYLKYCACQPGWKSISWKHSFVYLEPPVCADRLVQVVCVASCGSCRDQTWELLLIGPSLKWDTGLM